MLFSKKDYWTEKDAKKREKIVSKVQKERDPDRLVRIAMEAPIVEVSIAAIQKIQNYDQLLKIYNSQHHLVSEIAAALSDDFSRIRFLQEASFPNSNFVKIIVDSIQNKQLLYETICSGSHFNSSGYSLIMLISDRDILKKISIEGEKEIQRIAKEKLKDINALEAIVKNKDKSIQARFEAAKEIEDKYGDLEPKKELQKLGKPGPGRHILYPTVYKEWEKVEYICLRCGKIGGREDDSESTRHFGCNFNEEPCWGN